MLNKFPTISALCLTLTGCSVCSSRSYVLSSRHSHYRVHLIKDAISQAYVIENGKRALLVDAGSIRNGKNIARFLDSRGLWPCLIYLTHAHFDHCGGVPLLKKQYGCDIAIHAGDAGDLEKGLTSLGSVKGWGILMKAFFPVTRLLWKQEGIAPDVLLEDGDRLDAYGFDAYILHSPGHTGGSSSLILEDRYAFVGDLVSSRPWVHAQKYFADDWQHVSQSIERLRDTGISRAFPGHGSPFHMEELTGDGERHGAEKEPGHSDTPGQ